MTSLSVWSIRVNYNSCVRDNFIMATLKALIAKEAKLLLTGVVSIEVAPSQLSGNPIVHSSRILLYL